MNNAVTSKEVILETCRQLVSNKGLSFLNMRAVAMACEVALGSIYYYFPSKNDLLIATIESVWEDIFRWKDVDISDLSFSEYIGRLFEHICLGIQKYPNFFTIHSISFSMKAQSKADDSMERYLIRIREKMLNSLNRDKHIRENAFSSKFTKADFVDFVLSSIISLLVRNQSDCKVLLEIIHRTIYS